MTCAVPASVKAACRQRRMRLRADYPDRIIVESGTRFLPAPQTESRHRRARKLNPIWVSTYEDDGQRIVLGPYRELYDDPANGIHELSDWYRRHGSVKRTARRQQNRWWNYKADERLSPEDEARKRRELAKRLFPLVRKPVRKMLFSDEVQSELMQTFSCMASTAVNEGLIQDCKADRDDYVRLLQYASWNIASHYDETRPGNDGRSSASLVTFIKSSLGSKVQDMKRTRYALKRLGDVFTVTLTSDPKECENDSESFVMISDEALEDSSASVRDCDERMDIQSLRDYLASPHGRKYEKAFNLLVLDGLSIEEAAKSMGITYSAFKFNMLRPLREICKKFGFEPKSSKHSETR